MAVFLNPGPGASPVLDIFYLSIQTHLIEIKMLLVKSGVLS